MRVPTNKKQALSHIAKQINNLQRVAGDEFLAIRDDINIQAICFEVSEAELVSLYTKAGVIDDEAITVLSY